MDWFSTDNDLAWYLGIIILFFAFFIWNNRRLKQNRQGRRDRNFRKRYMDRKNEKR